MTHSPTQRKRAKKDELQKIESLVAWIESSRTIEQASGRFLDALAEFPVTRNEVRPIFEKAYNRLADGPPLKRS